MTLPTPSSSRAFTLVEMLVVMGIIVIIIGIAGPVVTSLSKAADIGKSVYDIAGMLEQSRAYAMSNNTYVYVGFNESDVNTLESGRQVSGSGKVGRVAVAVVASRDGSNTFAASNLIPVGKVQTFSNLHLVNLRICPSTGGMARPPMDDVTSVDPKYNLGDPDWTPSVTSFEYPLGTAAGAGKYTFTKVIQYDPQGVARVQQSINDDTIVKQIEIGLQQTDGATASTLSNPALTGSIAALQADGMTGSTRIYRP